MGINIVDDTLVINIVDDTWVFILWMTRGYYCGYDTWVLILWMARGY